MLEIPQPSITKISFKIIDLKFHSNLFGADELKIWAPSVGYGNLFCNLMMFE